MSLYNRSSPGFLLRKPGLGLLMERLFQHGGDGEGHGAADEGGEELGPAKGRGERLEHGRLQRAGGQQTLGQDTADEPHHDGVEGGELGGGGTEPGDDLTDDALAGLVRQQRQQQHVHAVARHDGGDGQDLGGDAQQKGQHGGAQGDHQAAAQSAHQGGHRQDGIDTGAGHELTHGLGQRLQADQQRQQQAGLGDPADLLIHFRFLLSFRFSSFARVPLHGNVSKSSL